MHFCLPVRGAHCSTDQGPDPAAVCGSVAVLIPDFYIIYGKSIYLPCFHLWPHLECIWSDKMIVSLTVINLIALWSHCFLIIFSLLHNGMTATTSLLAEMVFLCLLPSQLTFTWVYSVLWACSSSGLLLRVSHLIRLLIREHRIHCCIARLPHAYALQSVTYLILRLCEHH